MEDKIDFVVPWVNDRDKKWLQKKNEYYYHETGIKKDADLNQNSRYRDYATFKFWFRAVERYAPWVHKIVLITDHQVPEWLNVNNSKIKIVFHEDYIDSECLPTFSSNVIETSLQRIPELAEHFVLFNDDMFLNRPVKPDYFFKDGVPKDALILRPLYPASAFDKIIFNDVSVVNKHFAKRKAQKDLLGKLFSPLNGKYLFYNFQNYLNPKFSGFFDPHQPIAYTKDNFRDVWNIEPELLNRTMSHRFRNDNDVNDWVFRYYRLVKGEFISQNPKLGKYYELDQVQDIVKDITEKQHYTICVNDSDAIDNIDSYIKVLIDSFSKTFPNKSEFEF